MKSLRPNLLVAVAGMLAIAESLKSQICFTVVAIAPSTALAINSGSIKRVCEERAAIEAKIDGILNKATEEKRTANAEERVAIEALVAESNALRDHKTLLESREAIDDEIRDVQGQEREFQAHVDPLGKKPTITNEEKELAIRGWMLAHVPEGLQYVTDAHRAAAKKLNINIDAAEYSVKLLRGSEAKAAFRNAGWNTQSGPDGGYLRPPEGMVQSLEVAKMAWGGMNQVAGIIRTTDANPFAWPTANDTSNKSYRVGQGKSAGTGAKPTIKKFKWDAYKHTTGVIRISTESLRDLMVDLVQMLGEMIGQRFGRGQNEDCTTGNGADMASGILKDSVVGKTSTSPTEIDPDELLELIHSVDPAYRGMNGRFMMHDQTLLQLRLLKDGDGQWIFRPGLDAGQPDRLLGYPISINQDYETIAATKSIITFGDHSYYKIREVGQVRFATMPDIETDERLLCAYLEFDGKLLDPSNGGSLCPVKRLKMHA